jgi:cytochrome c-type biogenesis protein CcmE
MKKYLGLAIILAAFGFLVASSMSSNSLRSIPVDQLRLADASNESFVGQRLRVVGFVGSTPLKSVEEQTPSGVVKAYHFTVVDKDKAVAVTFRDALPDTFKAGGPVQVDGVYKAPGVMDADHVLTKCPSKYEAEANAQSKKYGSLTEAKKQGAPQHPDAK